MDAMEYNTYHDSGGYLQHLVKCCNACADLCLNSFHLATGCHGTHCFCHSLETLIYLKVVRTRLRVAHALFTALKILLACDILRHCLMLHSTYSTALLAYADRLIASQSS